MSNMQNISMNASSARASSSSKTLIDELNQSVAAASSSQLPDMQGVEQMAVSASTSVSSSSPVATQPTVETAAVAAPIEVTAETPTPERSIAVPVSDELPIEEKGDEPVQPAASGGTPPASDPVTNAVVDTTVTVEFRDDAIAENADIILIGDTNPANGGLIIGYDSEDDLNQRIVGGNASNDTYQRVLYALSAGDDEFTLNDTNEGGHNYSITYGNNWKWFWEDTVVHAGAGNDTITTGSGNDRIASDADFTDVTRREFDQFVATYFNKSVNDVTNADRQNYVQSPDFLNYLNHNFKVYENNGADIVNSGAGDDIVSTGGGNDTINTGTGDDLAYGGDGQDNIQTGDGNDAAYGDLYGTWGFDFEATGGVNLTKATAATLSSYNDTIVTGAGEDTLVGGYGADQLTGDTTTANDTVYRDTFVIQTADEYTNGARIDSNAADVFDTVHDFDTLDRIEVTSYVKSFNEGAVVWTKSENGSTNQFSVSLNDDANDATPLNRLVNVLNPDGNVEKLIMIRDKGGAGNADDRYFIVGTGPDSDGPGGPDERVPGPEDIDFTIGFAPSSTDNDTIEGNSGNFVDRPLAIGGTFKDTAGLNTNYEYFFDVRLAASSGSAVEDTDFRFNDVNVRVKMIFENGSWQMRLVSPSALVVQINEDTAIEANENFNISVLDPQSNNAQLDQSTLTIVNDDNGRPLTIDDIDFDAAFAFINGVADRDQVEGNVDNTVPLSMTAGLKQGVTGVAAGPYEFSVILRATTGSTSDAAESTDFTFNQTTVNFRLTVNANGTTSFTLLSPSSLSVLFDGDTIAEGDESFRLQFVHQTNGNVLDTSDNLIILNDDSSGTQRDYIFGTPQPDDLDLNARTHASGELVGDGDDVVYAYSSNDTIVAGQGNDVIYAGTGADTIWGDDRTGNQSGNDTIYGQAGNDVIRAGKGNDTVDGGADNDKIYGEDGGDILFGGDGADQIDGGAGNDSIRGGRGQDILMGGAGADTFVFDYNDFVGSSGTTNRDVIIDFNRDDKIDIKSLLDGYSGESVRFENVNGDVAIYLTTNTGERVDIALVDGLQAQNLQFDQNTGIITTNTDSSTTDDATLIALLNS